MFCIFKQTSITKNKYMVKKKKEGKALPKEAKSRAQYKCPDKVQKLIDLVNLVPFPVNVKNLYFEAQLRAQLLREKTGDSNATVNERDLLIDCIKDLPEEFHDYLKGFCYASCLRSIDISKADSTDIWKMSGAYAEFQRIRNETVNYARRLKTNKEGITFSNNWESFPITASGNILIDDNGKNYLDGLAGVIDEIIPDRFRMCEVCNKIFWAKREDSKTCSLPCLNKFNVRRHRALTPEEKATKKAQREANRKNIKDGKAKPTKGAKNNGTL